VTDGVQTVFNHLNYSIRALKWSSVVLSKCLACLQECLQQIMTHFDCAHFTS